MFTWVWSNDAGGHIYYVAQSTTDKRPFQILWLCVSLRTEKMSHLIAYIIYTSADIKVQIFGALWDRSILLIAEKID